LLLPPLVVRNERLHEPLRGLLTGLCTAVRLKPTVEVLNGRPGEDSAKSVDGLMIEVGDLGTSINREVSRAGDSKLTLGEHVLRAARRPFGNLGLRGIHLIG
jgi:hypothetical protein